MSLMTVGFALVTCVVLGYFLGHWLDGKLGTSPWLTVVGVLLGTGAGFLELFRTVARNLK
jgi:F0F1-type ATP synthase assembly protein I